MIRKALIASALGLTLAGGAYAQTPSPATQATPQTGPRAPSDGNNNTMQYPQGQAPNVVGGGQSGGAQVQGSGNNLSTERAGQTRGNSPDATGSNAAPRASGAGQPAAPAQVQGSGNNMSTTRPGVTQPGNSPTR
ncbi:hypothetical protein IAI18_04700 [Acetobacteraceae bacterium H6797]|nr:hypothetical protein [Acetobacteraceae bacterium H6797]